MKIQTLILALFTASLLPSCESTAHKGNSLILTCEDKKLMRTPYTPCPGEGCKVDCCSK